MGEPGRHRPERREALAILLAGGDPRRDGTDRAHHAAEHGTLRKHQLGEVLRRDHRDADVGHGAHLAAVARLGQHRDRAHPGGRRLAGDRLDPARLGDQTLDDPAQQQNELRVGRSVGLRHERVGRQLANLGHLAPPRELLVVELVEQVDRAQLFERGPLGLAHALARYSWISETAIDPSPTALATRLIERIRTSPATNTPGTLVSSA